MLLSGLVAKGTYHTGSVFRRPRSHYVQGHSIVSDMSLTKCYKELIGGGQVRSSSSSLHLHSEQAVTADAHRTYVCSPRQEVSGGVYVCVWGGGGGGASALVWGL